MAPPDSVYHLELRQFPKRVHRFNLDGPAVGAIVLPWVQEHVVELGEQKWSPHQAEITILEGPEVPLDRMSMGRGWGAAERVSEDVTQRVLAEARQAIATGAAGTEAARPPQAPAPGTGAGTEEAPAGAGQAQPASAAGGGADPLTVGLELAALLGSEPSRLLAAWRSVAARSSGLAPSESLALAERELARERPPDG
jgi:hypothetical protein